MNKNNKLLKILGIGLLTFVLGANVACGNPQEQSSQPSEEQSSQVEQSSEEQSSEEESSEDPIVEPSYKMLLGTDEVVLTKESEGIYKATIQNVVKDTEVKFYKNTTKISVSCSSLGNNVYYSKDYKYVIHNDASNVTLTLEASDDGVTVWMTGYEVATISNFSAKVNGEDASLIALTPGSGEVAKFTIDLQVKDKLVIYGDNEELYIGTNAMRYDSEYIAPLPGTYTITVDNYNRLSFIEPVLSTEELYLLYVNDTLTTPNFVAPENPEDKAQFTVQLSKGDIFSVNYIDGTVLGGGSALLDCSYTVYINKEGKCFLNMTNVKLNITATVDGEPISLNPLAPGENFAQYRITVEAGQVIEFKNDGESLKYHDSSETTFTYETAGTYTIYINKQLQVWDEPYVPVDYREVIVTGVDSALVTDRNIYIWAWPTNKDGAWVSEQAKVNGDGTITVYLPEGSDNFLLITTYLDKAADWGNVKSQTNDIKAGEGVTTTAVSWKTKEIASSGGGSSTSSTYVLKGDFDGGNAWATALPMEEVTPGIYGATITVSGAQAEFKVVKTGGVQDEWIGIGGSNVVITGAGTYQVTFNASTKAITFQAK